MKNAIAMPMYHQWRDCSSLQNLAHVLLHEIRLEGRRINAHGRSRIKESLVALSGQAGGSGVIDINWLLIDKGILLVKWPFNQSKGGFLRNHPSVLWIADIKNDGSPLVEACLRSIAVATVGRVTEGFEKNFVKQEVNQQVDSVVLLQDDLNLYAFPLEETPEEHLLHDVSSGKLRALGIEFSENGYTGYFDLYYCDLFVQGPHWCYSRFPWIKRDPVLSTKAYAYMVLMAGKECSPLACDGSESRECLMLEQFDGTVVETIHLLVFRAVKMGDWPYETFFNPRQVWEQAMEDWQVFLQHDDWEGVFEVLCNPDYSQHTMDTTWLYLVNSCYRAEYDLMKEALEYLCDWLTRVLETEEGVTTYCIW